MSVSVACPIEPHMLDKKMRRGFEDMVERVVMANVVAGDGKDLMLRVYLSGLYHGAEAAKRTASTVEPVVGDGGKQS